MNYKFRVALKWNTFHLNRADILKDQLQKKISSRKSSTNLIKRIWKFRLKNKAGMITHIIDQNSSKILAPIETLKTKLHHKTPSKYPLRDLNKTDLLIKVGHRSLTNQFDHFRTRIPPRHFRSLGGKNWNNSNLYKRHTMIY